MLSCVPAGIVWGISGWARVRKTVAWWTSILGLWPCVLCKGRGVAALGLCVCHPSFLTACPALLSYIFIVTISQLQVSSRKWASSTAPFSDGKK